MHQHNFADIQLIAYWSNSAEYMGRSMRKRVFGHMRTAKTQISLRIRAVWSGPSLSANRISGYYKMYEWRAKARMILCACAGWSDSTHFCMFEGTFSHDAAHKCLCTGTTDIDYDSYTRLCSYCPFVIIGRMYEKSVSSRKRIWRPFSYTPSVAI